MNKVKKWLGDKIFKLICSDIRELILDNISDKDNTHCNDIRLKDLIGHTIEVRHYTEEVTSFIKVAGVIESIVHSVNNGTNYIDSVVKGVIFIDITGFSYRIDNLYEYEIRKKERY